MPAQVIISIDRRINSPVRAAFEAACAPELVRALRRFGPVPGVKSFEGERAPWSHAGQQRRLRMDDDAAICETLHAIDPPNRLRYEIAEFEGLAGSLMEKAEGQWAFAPASDGASTVSWTYCFTPRNTISRAVLIVSTHLFWRPWMQQGLALMARELEQNPAPTTGASA